MDLDVSTVKTTVFDTNYNVCFFPVFQSVILPVCTCFFFTCFFLNLPTLSARRGEILFFQPGALCLVEAAVCHLVIYHT